MKKPKSAVERQLLTLSEAARALGDRAEPLCPGHDWKGFRGMGDLLRHAYHRIDDRLVWDSVTRELPPLKTSVAKALAELAGEGGILRQELTHRTNLSYRAGPT